MWIGASELCLEAALWSSDRRRHLLENDSALAAANPRYSEGVEFLLNESESLEKIPSESIDFLLSLIVLQHIPKKFIKGYLSEFLRVTKPGGLIVFQIPTRKIGPVKKEIYWEGRPLNWDSPSLGKFCYLSVTRFFRWIPGKFARLL